ncbi:glycyl-tRNA synthetase, beta subunit [Citrifermentans bemidjiense Bem]|uniref:Glycine--tRNA ligase beta subunit n=1 Tax=Citrifermentans bemidjiense (strain ATCC BAA-1014 / DSM 16622 / JCM 12645 / Bem) TaxID=404380 RepID=SYGB_CITBB|nr:glycine--tRNA ligase subunit beta [Citrifermentans bemidjiense]B5ED84.1 RecName: Full=Glycine--tRNA ligase beta subunit; AltName: Full=Glycyl-tRNA synthetase beta subunit; Short=GlyRS [Citrifermentans bemidjiense Bem]ACH37670.1 glycyl-tRNA synthetase, beta subunit [Citrifermentans bemidjiense Bem]
MAKDLFLEIGCEEIPAGFVPKAMADMELLIKKEFDSARIEYGEIVTLGTPRRLVLAVKGVAERQPDAELTAMGPAKSHAYDADGNPTKAAQGFARGQGIDVSQLKLVTTEKGEYLAAVKSEIGRATAELLPELLPRLIGNIPFKKSMRWADFDVRFARPIHWIVALFDGKVVPFSFGNIDSGSASRGHRFMANTSFPVRDLAHYLEECERHFVIPDPNKRKEIIRAEIERVAKQAKGNVLPDEALLEQVSYLVEYPSAVHGTFSPDFLVVPREVLITSMREHQRYFSLVDDEGKLLPGFITINNTITEDPQVVVKGNERVLRARLSDARFFFDEDHKVRLEARVESLKSVVYQAKLGTSYEKMERFRELGKRLAQRLNPAVTKEVERAATLCKADLVSGMVGEFPEVQGIMGREYALHDGEEKAVANAIAEHYLPTQAGGELPASDIGAFVSLADKMDTICGCFSVGLIPTGSADPYALRRSALGIINIILDKGYREPLSDFVKASLDLLSAKATRPLAEVQKDVLDFFRGRFVNLMADRFPSDAVEAVVSVSFDDLVEAAAKIEALAGFRNRDDFGPLAVAFKRVCNIVKDGVDTPVSTELFQDAAEGELHQALTQVSGKVAAALKKADYLAALTEIATLKPAVDLFFEKVMVMAEDERVRQNRLALLTGIARLFGSLADFSRLSP